MPLDRALPRGPRRANPRSLPSVPESGLRPRPRTRIRIFIVDEQGIMRDGLCALLSSTDEFEIVGSESNLADALGSAATAMADVIVIDLPPTPPEGPEAIGSIKAFLPGVRVLVLTFRKDDGLIDAVLRAGADGYVLKNDNCSELFTGLRSVAAGRGFISPSICDHVVDDHTDLSRDNPSGELTNRERQVIRLIAAGRRTREIAQILSLSHKTIEKHRTSLMRKLGLRNASAVAAYAIAHGLG
jgi:two-component system response regulator NreC